MLFRAVAPVDTVKQVLRDIALDQSPFTQDQVLGRVLDPESREVLTLQTSQEKWERVLVETQATPNEINSRFYGENSYFNQDVIWLSSLEPGEAFMSGAEFDLFIYEV